MSALYKYIGGSVTTRACVADDWSEGKEFAAGPTGDTYRLINSDAVPGYTGYALCVKRGKPHVHKWTVTNTGNIDCDDSCCGYALSWGEVNRRLNALEPNAYLPYL